MSWICRRTGEGNQQHAKIARACPVTYLRHVNLGVFWGNAIERKSKNAVEERENVRVGLSSSSPKSLYSLFFFSGSGVVSLAASGETASFFSTTGSDIGDEGGRERGRTGETGGAGGNPRLRTKVCECGADGARAAEGKKRRRDGPSAAAAKVLNMSTVPPARSQPKHDHTRPRPRLIGFWPGAGVDSGESRRKPASSFRPGEPCWGSAGGSELAVARHAFCPRPMPAAAPARAGRRCRSSRPPLRCPPPPRADAGAR